MSLPQSETEWVYDPEKGDGDLPHADSYEAEQEAFLSRRWSCDCCGTVHTNASLYQGRGRHLGEHPEHYYSSVCGHSMTWFGRSLVADPDDARMQPGDPNLDGKCYEVAG